MHNAPNFAKVKAAIINLGFLPLVSLVPHPSPTSFIDEIDLLCLIYAMASKQDKTDLLHDWLLEADYGTDRQIYRAISR